MKQTRDTLLADRVRAAACIVLKQANGPLRISEIVTGIRRLDVPVPAPVNKTVSDALRRAVALHHVRRYGWGVYVIDALPRATEYGMRQRVLTYQQGVTVHPHRRNPLTPEAAAALHRARAGTDAGTDTGTDTEGGAAL